MEIHRCRFVPYPPSTINALAFSHSQITGKKLSSRISTLRLAIGRANGDIEIWNPLNGAWVQETILRGGEDRSVDGLVWVQDPDTDDGAGNTIAGRLRLFSIGYTTTITEWDIVKGQPMRQSSGNHGEIWCLAAQPSLPKPEQLVNGASGGKWTGQNLIAGCTDGAVVLYSTADDDLQLQKVLVRPSSKKAKIISIVFQNRTTVVAGCTDSTIRIIDIQNGSLLRTMSLGSGPAGGPKEILVWAVKCLPDGSIVTGDSTGELRIWDGKTYTLVQRIKSHREDILSLATSADGLSIFSGGMDRRTTVYKQIGQTGRQRWAEVSHRRYHDHDVKTMATFESKNLSVVVSGGPDAAPIVLPLKEYGLENQRALPHLPQASIVQSAPSRRLVMGWWDREVHIWRVNKDSKPAPELYDSDSEADQPKPKKLVAKIYIKGEANITSATMSNDGNTLAVSTAADVKLFALRHGEQGAVKVQKLPAPASWALKGARMLHFSPDGKWLVFVRNDNNISALRFHSEAGTITFHSVITKLHRIDRQIKKHIRLGGLGTYDRNVSRIAFSSDSRVLAVSDLAGYIDTWVLEGVEDLTQLSVEQPAGKDTEGSDSDSEEEQKPDLVFAQHWTRSPSASLIPKLPSSPVVLSFRPSLASNKENRIQGVSPHPTRHTPHPVSHELHVEEDRLLVVTAGSVGNSSKVFEFNVMKGSLSPWSRSNPISNFPEEYKGLRDQAIGCIWDISEDKERVWLYGSSWLWMFDLSRNLPVYDTQPQLTNGQSTELTNGDLRPRKRKRVGEVLPDAELRKGTSGAGSKVPDHEMGTGMSRKMHRSVTGEANEEIKQLTRQQDEMDVDDDDEDDDEDLLLRAASKSVEPSAELTATNGEANGRGPAHWWNTYKYRPIMGIVPLHAGDGSDALEVALVERPIWEADLPPRYYGDQEWEKPGV